MAELTSVTIGQGWHPEPGSSFSLHADAYTKQRWFEADQHEIIGRSWQWVCHSESLRNPGAYVTDVIAGMPVVAVRGQDGQLKAFYNVCKHRAHELVQGPGDRPHR